MSDGLTHQEQQVLLFVLRENIASLEAELLTHQWVSVKDRLPDDETEVLVTSLTENETIYQMDLCDGVWRDEVGMEVAGNPTHWMELPPLPPEKEGE